MPSIHVVGATGRSGSAICAALRQSGAAVVPVARNPARWRGPESPRVAAIEDAGALARALADATHVVSSAHARHAAAVLAASPENARFVFLGSTRKFTRWPDAHGEGVKAGEAAFLASGRKGLMLHPTMIYGAQGENNVRRLAALLRRLPIVPLPNGGRALVQPIYQYDVARAVLAALRVPVMAPESLVIAGPAPMPYADFVREIAAAAGLPPPRIVTIPNALLSAAAALARCLPGMPKVGADEIRRLTENKDFTVDAMRTRLNVHPIPLTEGLRLTFRHASN